MDVGTVEEVIVQNENTRPEMGAGVVQWEDQDDGDDEQIPNHAARLRVWPSGQEMEIQTELVPEYEVS